MSVKIRLKRLGTKNKPFWRVVVADSKMPRDGRFIEELGYYDPKTNPAKYHIKEERAKYWLSVGAQPSDVVRSILKKKGIAQKSKSGKK